ncbi:hypothetical protein OY671_012792, partial [Metschnikowia pulcherrima]
YEHSSRNNEAESSAGGALVAETGVFTGRSPKDKFTVRDASTDKTMWWGGNQSITSEQQEPLRAGSLRRRRSEFQIKTRVFTEMAWHSSFIRTSSRRPEMAELASFAPESTIVDSPSFRADPKRHGCKSENVV